MNNKASKLLLAEFESPATLLGAARKLRDAGYSRFDCHSPFPIHGMDSAMGVKRSPLSLFVGSFAIVALGGALYMQYWMSAVNYPLVLSGKPFNSFQAFTPVVFALTVLTAAMVSFIGALAFSKLPRYNHSAFSSANFERFADCGFFVSIESTDPKYDENETRAFIQSAGGKNIEVLG